METSLQLNEGENLVLECFPEKQLIIVMTFKYLMVALFLLFIYFSIPNSLLIYI